MRLARLRRYVRCSRARTAFPLFIAATILIGYDDSDGADRALDRAIEEAKSSGDSLVVLSIFEMLFDPEGPQNFGNINESAEMIPLVEPA